MAAPLRRAVPLQEQKSLQVRVSELEGIVQRQAATIQQLTALLVPFMEAQAAQGAAQVNQAERVFAARQGEMQALAQRDAARDQEVGALREKIAALEVRSAEAQLVTRSQITALEESIQLQASAIQESAQAVDRLRERQKALTEAFTGHVHVGPWLKGAWHDNEWHRKNQLFGRDHQSGPFPRDTVSLSLSMRRPYEHGDVNPPATHNERGDYPELDDIKTA